MCFRSGAPARSICPPPEERPGAAPQGRIKKGGHRPPFYRGLRSALADHNFLAVYDVDAGRQVLAAYAYALQVVNLYFAFLTYEAVHAV